MKKIGNSFHELLAVANGAPDLVQHATYHRQLAAPGATWSTENGGDHPGTPSFQENW